MAVFVLYSNFPGYRDRQALPAKRFRDFRRLKTYANRYAPEGERWCNWGLHYGPQDRFRVWHRQERCRACAGYMKRRSVARQRQRAEQELKEMERDLRDQRHEYRILKRVCDDLRAQIDCKRGELEQLIFDGAAI